MVGSAVDRMVIGNVSSAEQLNNADIAVVGVACEYPGGAHDIESFWSMREMK